MSVDVTLTVEQPQASVTVERPSVTVQAAGAAGAKGDKGDTGATGATGPIGPTGEGVPVGGTTGQVLRKKTNTDFDTEFHSLVKADVGLDQVDDTSDINKPVSTAQQTALNAKQNLLGYTAEDTANKSTDTNLGTSDTLFPTQKAAKTYIDNAVTGLLDFKGSTDASVNPNYPAASKGDSYVVSVAGKIGGASGKAVDVGDVYLAIADNAGGTEASVGSSWIVLEHNLQGALLSANNLSDLASASSARTNLGLGSIATQAAGAVTITGGTISGTQITRRVGSVASSATPSINTDNVDQFNITALAAAITSMTSNLTGTPSDGQRLIIRILDNGTARAITWGASFVSRGATLPTTTVISKYLYVGLIYNSVASVWDCVAVSQEA